MAGYEKITNNTKFYYSQSSGLFTNLRNNVDDRYEPWGIPAVLSYLFEETPLIAIGIDLPGKKSTMQTTRIEFTAKELNLYTGAYTILGSNACESPFSKFLLPDTISGRLVFKIIHPLIVDYHY